MKPQSSENLTTRRKMLQLVTAASAVGLAGCEEPRETPSDDTERQFPDWIEEYLTIQERLGDSMAELAENSHERRELELHLRHMTLGLLARDNSLNMLHDAPLPSGADREAFFELPDEYSGEPTERDEGYEEFVAHREFAPETIDEWAQSVEQFEDLLIEMDRLRDVVAEEVEELRRFVEARRRMLEESVQRGVQIELSEIHPHFVGENDEDEEYALIDTLWVINRALELHPLPLKDYLDDSDDSDDSDEEKEVMDVIVEVIVELCEYECVEAQVWIVVGPAESKKVAKIDDHAWIKYEETYDLDCSGQSDPYTETTELGFTLSRSNPIQDDSGREVNCTEHVWSGACDAPEYEEFQSTLDDEIAGDAGTWHPWSNCLNWALDMAEILNEDLAEELDDKTKSRWNRINWPSRVCED